jgi:hypothetical protein
MPKQPIPPPITLLCNNAGLLIKLAGVGGASLFLEKGGIYMYEKCSVLTGIWETAPDGR